MSKKETTEANELVNEQKAVVYETKYTIEELAAAYDAFKTVAIVVRAALKTAGKTEYTMAEATEIIEKFKNKEVNA